MAEAIRIEIEDREVRAALSTLLSRGANLRPALEEIGEFLVETTKRRFETSTAPDGSKWMGNSDLTIARYLNSFKGSRKKDGSLSKKGAERLAGKKPLIGETRSLSSTIDYQVAGNTLEVGSPLEYAGVQQFGAKARQFNGVAPWGDIPAREFLGLSSDDSAGTLDILAAFLDPGRSG